MGCRFAAKKKLMFANRKIAIGYDGCSLAEVIAPTTMAAALIDMHTNLALAHAPSHRPTSKTYKIKKSKTAK